MPFDDPGSQQKIFHRTIEPNEEDANIDLVQLVAEIEGCPADELPSLWSRIDDVAAHIFSDPPGPEAQVHVQFTYAGYRIDVDQSGDVKLMKVAETPTAGR